MLFLLFLLQKKLIFKNKKILFSASKNFQRLKKFFQSSRNPKSKKNLFSKTTDHAKTTDRRPQKKSIFKNCYIMYIPQKKTRRKTRRKK
jgi:hypothetical protein